MEKSKIKYLVIHHVGGSDTDPLADTSNQTFEIVNEYHKQKWNFKSNLGYYIGYQYFIDKNGKITQGREDTEEGAHTIGYNKQSIGICLSGNFDVTMPSKAQIESLKALISRKMIDYNIPIANVVPHRAFAKKSCFGKNLPDNWVQTLFLHNTSLVEPCFGEREQIKEKDVQIGRLQNLVTWLINLIKK